MEPSGGQGRGGIGTRVKAARGRIGWSREELAVRSGMSWSAISQIESGRRRNLRPATLSSIAQALGVSVDYLIDGGLNTPVMLNHLALLYEGGDAFVDGAAPYVLEGVERSEPVLVVTSKENRALLKKRLGPDAKRVEMVDSTRWYTAPAEALSAYGEFMSQRLARGSSWVRIVGEPVWAGRRKQEVEAWIRYESVLNLAFAQAPASIVCPYDTGSLTESILSQVHAGHPQTMSNGAVTKNSGYIEPGSSVLEG
jgi:transcriptional regulator with XRE-family HTH domain